MPRRNAFYTYCTCRKYMRQKKALNQRHCSHVSRNIPAEPFQYVKPPKLMLLKNAKDVKHIKLPVYVSEKLDGIRALWDGRQFVTRNGRILHNLPLNMPVDVKLDGELYAGIGSRDQIHSVLQSDTKSRSTWFHQLGIEFRVFDIHQHEPFSRRYQHLLDLSYTYEFTVIPHVKHIHMSGIQRYLSMVKRKGGEGIVIRVPDRGYKPGRSKYALKCKRLSDLFIAEIE